MVYQRHLVDQVFSWWATVGFWLSAIGRWWWINGFRLSRSSFSRSSFSGQSTAVGGRGRYESLTSARVFARDIHVHGCSVVMLHFWEVARNCLRLSKTMRAH